MSHQIKTIDYKSDHAKEEFVDSLHLTGFAVLRNHPINKEMINSIYYEWEKFFTSDEKYSYTFNMDTQDGYFPYQSENAKGYKQKDLKEFYHYYEWGMYPKNISNKTKILHLELVKLGRQLLEWIDNLTPNNIRTTFSMRLSEMVHNSRTNLLRIIHYPPLNDQIEKGAVRASAHEDINLITLLVAGTQEGLQVLTKQNTWLDVKSNPGWIVINIGDMLSECSNGYFPSTTHRVINPSSFEKKISRYTMPLFMHPKDDVILSKKYTAKSFLEERLKELGLK